MYNMCFFTSKSMMENLNDLRRWISHNSSYNLPLPFLQSIVNRSSKWVALLQLPLCVFPVHIRSTSPITLIIWSWVDRWWSTQITWRGGCLVACKDPKMAFFSLLGKGTLPRVIADLLFIEQHIIQYWGLGGHSLWLEHALITQNALRWGPHLP